MGARWVGGRQSLGSLATAGVRGIVSARCRKEFRRSLTDRVIHLPIDMLRALRVARRSTYNADGVLTVHNADFSVEPRFAKAYAAGVGTGSWSGADVRWRMHVICWAAALGLKRPGDFVECGVSRGGSAMTLLRYTELYKTDRKLFLLDTFHGPAREYMSETERRNLKDSPQFEECLDEVRRTFAPYPSTVRIVPGAVPETLKTVDAEQIAFLSIDMNNAAPEIAAAEFFWPKLTTGAVVVLDDYGWSEHIEQKRAFDRFAERHEISILSLPTGQALMVKE
jgi:O-methyltransferase